MFKKTIFSILAGAAIAVLATPIPTVAGDSINVVVRTTSDFKSLGTTEEFSRLSKFCSGSSSKRDIKGRAYTAKGGSSVFDVKTGEHQQTLQIGGLMTEGLISCMGVVALGSPPADNEYGVNARFLLHMYGAEMELTSTFESFVTNIKKAKEAGLEDLKVYMRKPDLTAAKPMMSDGAWSDWTDKDTKLSNLVAEKLESLIKSELGVSPKIVASPMVPAVKKTGDAGSMEVSGTKTENHVYVDGNMVS